MAVSQLFTPVELRGVTLKNRVLISPMWQYCGQHGNPTDYHLMHYGRFAEGGAGLVMQEGTTVEKRGRGTHGDLGIWDDHFIPGLQRIVNLVKQNGGVPGIQLMHCGRKVMERAPWKWGNGTLLSEDELRDLDPHEWDRMAPSPLAQTVSAVPTADAPSFPLPREMTTQDIEDVVAAFVAAAVRADKAGYEVVEIHAGHGYLVNLFLNEASNFRTDSYGGSFENRIRFLCEIVEGVRAVLPDYKPLLVRVSAVDGSTWSLDDTVRLARVLKNLGVEMIDCSMGGVKKDIGTDRRSSYAYQASLAETVRREAKIMTNAVGLIVHAQHAEEIISRGQADTIAIGREAIYNPNWPIDAAHKLGADPEFSLLPERQRFWFHYRALGMDGFLPSTHSPTAVPALDDDLVTSNK
ncbi:MAG: NADH:flavin oxidoreductase/NADH oxidase [Actinomycetota bacterium]